MNQSYFTIVLNAHLPFVRSNEANKMEERWVYHAIADSYIPLLWQLEKETYMRKKITLSISPTLMEMLNDSLIQRRFYHFLDHTLSLLTSEKKVVTSNEEKKLVDFYLKRFEKIKQTYNNWNQNLLSAFKHYYDQQKIDLMTTSASHTFLPYILTKEGITAQIHDGIECFEKHFMQKPSGFWLPKCGYSHGLDEVLAKAGIKYTFVDEKAFSNANPAPKNGMGAPVLSPHGIVLFPRNRFISDKVCSNDFGYPGDFDYREYYRDVAYERDISYIAPYILPDHLRVDTGLKYRRITGPYEEKDFYDREKALSKVEVHMEDFWHTLEEQYLYTAQQSFPPHLIATSFDAELLGHHWFEGPDWLGSLLNKQHSIIEFTTPHEFLEQHYEHFQKVQLTLSSQSGYGETWLNEKNAWIYRELHQMEKDLNRSINDHPKRSTLETRSLKQMVREWYLASSSDWASLIAQNQKSKLAAERVKKHVERFHKIQQKLYHKKLSVKEVIKWESDTPFISEIKLSHFISDHDVSLQVQESGPINEGMLNILILSWEYPPNIIGGLGRHVKDLSKSLIKAGHNVFVVTTNTNHSIKYEQIDGVHVYRVKGLQSQTNEFLHWINSLNISLANQAMELTKKYSFDVIHAHDWLVGDAARSLQSILKKPLVATIHATEHGRNDGIKTELQKNIHAKEKLLLKDADHTIVCSEYMNREITHLFSVPQERISIIPNGVYPFENQEKDISWINRFGTPEDIYLIAIGRLVKEKGIQTLIAAVPYLIQKHKNLKVLIAGVGPMLHEYKEFVSEKNLEDVIHFLGFIEDNEKEQLLAHASMTIVPSLYEPFGIVALESLIAEVPTVVTDVGGLSEVIDHGENGLKMHPNNINSLIEQVDLILNDKDLSTTLAKNGKAKAIEKFEWEQISYKTIELYKTTIREFLKINM